MSSSPPFEPSRPPSTRLEYDAVATLFSTWAGVTVFSRTQSKSMMMEAPGASCTVSAASPAVVEARSSVSPGRAVVLTCRFDDVTEVPVPLRNTSPPCVRSCAFAIPDAPTGSVSLQSSRNAVVLPPLATVTSNDTVSPACEPVAPAVTFFVIDRLGSPTRTGSAVCEGATVMSRAGSVGSAKARVASLASSVPSWLPMTLSTVVVYVTSMLPARVAITVPKSRIRVLPETVTKPGVLSSRKRTPRDVVIWSARCACSEPTLNVSPAGRTSRTTMRSVVPRGAPIWSPNTGISPTA